MAVDISDRYKRKLKLPNYADLHARIKLRSLVERHRARRREKLNTAIPARTLAHPCQITDALEAAAPHFLEHGWAFIEGVFPPTITRRSWSTGRTGPTSWRRARS